MRKLANANMIASHRLLCAMAIAAATAGCGDSSSDVGPPYAPHHVGHEKHRDGRWIVIERSGDRYLRVDSAATILPNKNVLLWLLNGASETQRTRQRMEFNCSLREVRSLLSVHDSAGRRSDVVGDSTWQPVIPESMGETLLRVACGPPWPDDSTWLGDSAKSLHSASPLSPPESAPLILPRYPRLSPMGGSTQGNALTSPGDKRVWRELFTMKDGMRVSLDTATAAYDPTGRGVIEVLVEESHDTRLNDSTSSRVHVNHWMVDCREQRYRFIGGEYYDRTGKLVHEIHNDRQGIATLPWERAEPKSPYSETLVAACRVLTTLPSPEQLLNQMRRATPSDSGSGMTVDQFDEVSQSIPLVSRADERASVPEGT